MKWEIETEFEKETGKWIAEITTLPGCLAYGKTEFDAMDKVLTLAEKILEQIAAHGHPL